MPEHGRRDAEWDMRPSTLDDDCCWTPGQLWQKYSATGRRPVYNCEGKGSMPPFQPEIYLLANNITVEDAEASPTSWTLGCHMW